ncbi:hypothetical protein ACH5RR_018082 [Cinchona calisaya]|uniref:Uncharacterized protein n=1 Tax=Cinchona calisaya TaxID=153742 RepID=A0ABD2ZQH4_9GENT
MATSSSVSLSQFIVRIRFVEFPRKKTLFPIEFLNDYAFDIQDFVKFCMPSSDVWCIVLEKKIITHVVTYWLHVVGKVKKGTIGLRNVPWVGSSRVCALNKQRVKSLSSSSFRKNHLREVESIFHSTFPFFIASMHSHGFHHSHMVYVLVGFSYNYLKQCPRSIDACCDDSNEWSVSKIVKMLNEEFEDVAYLLEYVIGLVFNFAVDSC